MASRGENIHKRKDKRWEGRYIKGYDENHKARYGSVYAHTYGEVRSKLDYARNNAEKMSSALEIDEKTLEYYSGKWLTSIRGYIKQSTFVKYSNILKNHIIPALGSFKISELTTETVKSFAESKLLSGNTQNNSGLSGKTVKDILSVLKLILKSASEAGIVCSCNFELISIRSAQNHADTIHKNERVKLINIFWIILTM